MGFKTYHPVVNFTYFAFVIIFSCTLLHPAALCISLLSGFVYSVILRGRRAIKTNLRYMLPTAIATALINPAFNHEGITIISYLPSGNPLTLESIIYGLSAAAMLISVICHFSCCNEVMTSDKFIYLFGKSIPSLSLIISMTLRFVPEFKTQLRIVADAQRCMGRDVSSGNIIKRARCGLDILSIMATWSLENAIGTADSMKSRGYGLPGRTAFSIFKFDKRDKTAFFVILSLGAYTFTGALSGGMSFEFFPQITTADVSVYGISIFASYFFLCIFPVIIEISEVRKWKASRSKI